MTKKNNISYYIIISLIWLLTRLPRWCYKWLTSFIYFVIYYIAKYRRQVSRVNLTKSFPEKSLQQIISIEKKYYRHMANMMLENFYLRFLSKNDFKKLITVNNPELLQKYYNQGKSMIVMYGHYGNWEYSGGLGFFTKLRPSAVYKRQSSQAFDRLFYDMRVNTNVYPIEMKEVMRKVPNYVNEKPSMVYMFADQTPMKQDIHHWITFLNQTTGVYTGSEKLAKKYDLVVVYCEILPTGNGKYTFDIQLITDDPKNTAQNQITDKYFELLEKTIINNPEYWLWSHRRWKHQPDNNNIVK